MQLRNKHVVIVGGTSGIGLATAEAASAAGARVTVIGRDPQKLERISNAHPTWRTAAAEITDMAAIEAAFASGPSVDHVCVSAGTIIPEPVTGSMERLRAPFEERVFGLLNVIRAALPRLAPDGSITCTTGDLVERPVAGLAAVAAAAAAVETLAKALVLELAPVRFNVISPGAVDTPLMTGLLGEEGRQAMLEQQAARTPIGRVGTSAEIAAFVLAIMTNPYVNGAILPVDGGLRLV